MKTVMICNEKGGVGKTSLAVTAAQGLACHGQRVLLVDGDPQGHATIRMGLNKRPALYDLLVREANFSDVTAQIAGERFGVPGNPMPRGEVHVLASNRETMSIVQFVANTEILAIRLDELKDRIDVVVIDTPPTPSLLHALFYAAADGIVYPTTLTYTSFDGLVESIKARVNANTMRERKWQLPPIEVMGIVPVMYRSSTFEQNDNLAKLKAQFDNLVWPPMRLRTLWTEAESQRLPVWALGPTSDAANDAWNLISFLEEHVYARAQQ